MFKASVITISDKGFRGEREDTAGPLAAQMLKDAGYDVLTISIVPDEQPMIEAELRRHADVPRREPDSHERWNRI